MLDRAKWFAVFAIVIAGIVGNWWFDGINVFYRALALVAMALLAGFILFQTEKGRNLWVLMRDARSEVRRVIWPTRQETLQTTLIVILLILVFALILWALDSLLTWIVQMLIG
ncbi:MAG: preprotein translocase subunit SecE [Gammaproteobacteria bacterium]|nr:preprotein translocase subunit SecE [Gammaproteobacteria bacterium]